MPGNVTLTEARAQVVAPAETDWTAVVIGCSSTSPLAAGLLSNVYRDPFAARTDYGYGDGIDLLTHGLATTPAYSAQPPMAFYRAPSTTPGAFGTIDLTHMVGTTIPAGRVTSTPLGTYQAGIRIIDDGQNGAGVAVGTTGAIYEWSLDNGRTWSAPIALATSTSITIPNSGVIFDLGPPTAQVTALVTYANAIRTAALAHFPYVTASVHGAADTTSDDNVHAAATDLPTAVLVLTTVCDALVLHFARGSTVHTTADVLTSMVASLAAKVAVVASGSAQDAMTLGFALEVALELHENGVNFATWHGAADSVNVVSAAHPTRGLIMTGDAWYQPTTAPSWVTADLYNGATTPPTGAFATIAEDGLDFGVIAIAEPVATSDFASLTAGLTYCETTWGKEAALLIRFRDPAAGETDAAYIAAFQAFSAANTDDRIGCCVGSCWLTDALTARRYLRSFEPAFFKRVMSFGTQPAEKLAHNPVYTADGPLEGVSLVDDSNNLIAHDEQKRGGIETSNGISLRRIPNQQYRVGAYVSRAPVMRPTDSAIYLWMDRRVANAMERVAVSIAWSDVGGKDLYDPATLLLDEASREAIAGTIRETLSRRFANEIQNPDDPNLVLIDAAVTVSGPDVDITGTINPLLFGYTRNIGLKFSARR